MKTLLKELWGQANSPYQFKLPTLKEILIPAAVAGAFLILKHNPTFIVPAFILLFGVFFFWLLVQARNDELMQRASGGEGAEHDLGGNLSEGTHCLDDDFDFTSLSDGPICNIDGTPMIGMMDINGNPYGITSSSHMLDND